MTSQKKINKRQDEVLFILRKAPYAVKKILEELNKIPIYESVSRITLIRDLNYLLDIGLINRHGQGRGIYYALATKLNILSEIDVEKYFQADPDDREINDSFNFSIFDNFKRLLIKPEEQHCKKINKKYRESKERMSETLFKKEYERLTIELSWKSSKIEGNTYSILETEQLIKNHTEAKGHTKEEALMILNHKSALDFIVQNANDYKELSLTKIEKIHSLLIEGLNVEKGIRKILVGITGTKYRPLDNEFQIKEALEKTFSVVNREDDPVAKALILSTMIAYIQPFEDGNKRTSRLAANAVLLAHGYCPLSYRSIDEAEYKKAIILFYEQNNISYYKKLLLEQFEFAVENYFL